MRRLFLITCFFVLPAHFLFAQVYTVCNIAGVTADFSNLQQAADSVPDGSTLYVFPSPVNYGSLSFRKRLYIIGTGYMLDENIPPYTSPDSSGVTLTSVTIDSGASNSVIRGITVFSTANNCFNVSNVQRVTINRCMAYTPAHAFRSDVYFSNTVGCTVSQCYLFINGYDDAVYSDNGSASTLFCNNIIDDRGIGYSITVSNAKANNGQVTFDHNTFYGEMATSVFGNYNYTNNIFVNSNLSKTNFNGSDRSMNGWAIRNIATDTALFQKNSSNYSGVKPDTVFAGYDGAYHSWDEKWKINTGSFAKTYASDGGEAGAYGAAAPYVLSGIPDLPAVYGINISTDSTRGNILLHIKAKASY